LEPLCNRPAYTQSGAPELNDYCIEFLPPSAPHQIESRYAMRATLPHGKVRITSATDVSRGILRRSRSEPKIESSARIEKADPPKAEKTQITTPKTIAIYRDSSLCAMLLLVQFALLKWFRPMPDSFLLSRATHPVRNEVWPWQRVPPLPSSLEKRLLAIFFSHGSVLARIDTIMNSKSHSPLTQVAQRGWCRIANIYTVTTILPIC
jgi:hypothetical protein